MKNDFMKVLEGAAEAYKASVKSGDISQEDLKSEIEAWKEVRETFVKTVDEIEALALPDADTWVDDMLADIGRINPNERAIF